MQSDLVSVIIPAYNASRYIRECLDSVLGQTHKNLEIIVINDGSTDNTHDILREIQDDRLIVINQKNMGCSASKNIGLNIASGNYIQYLDADDLLSVDKIKLQLEVLQSSKSALAVCKTIVIGHDKNIINGEIDTDLLKLEGSGVDFLLRLLGSSGVFGMVQPNAYLLTRGLVEKVGPWLTDLYPCPDEDGEYFSRVLLNSSYVYFTSGVNYYRKIGDANSLSQQISIDRIINQLKTTERKFVNLIESGNKSEITMLLLQVNITHIVYAFSNKFPEVIPFAEAILEKYNISRFKLLGQGKFQKLSYVFGVKNALKIRWLTSKLLLGKY
jgi:glycosyltransferase involved in cell wall biosynthesis